jgi:acyl-CoA reductase-like NAD-dependent aldehyde dehydrogenase
MENLLMSEFELLIGGRLMAGASRLEVINPATEEIFATCARASKAQLDEAVAAAKAAFPKWSGTPIAERRKAIIAMADTLEAHAPELARVLTGEQGQPLAKAEREVLAAAAYFRYFATLDLPAKVLEDSAKARVEVHRKPLGVVGAIVPWNFPLVLMSYKVPPALLAGNTVVLKPAATTPLATLRFAALAKDIVPPGVLNVIADANDLGGEMSKHPDIRKISFTGSTQTGKHVMAGAADTLKRLSLELGGNDALIVLDDVDPKEVAPRIFNAAMQNTGQICIAAKRVYVHESLYEAMCEELAKLADAAVVGNGLEPQSQLGPLQNKQQFERVLRFIEAGKKDGKVIAGGGRAGDKGYFIRPTIIRDICDGAQLVDEEQFGPVLPLIKYSHPQDAVAHANASSYGLGGSIWSKNSERAWELAKSMQSGTVWVNKHGHLQPHVPFGGSNLSGIGVELGEEGLQEFTQVQVLSMAR